MKVMQKILVLLPALLLIHTAQAAAQPGETFRDCPDCPEMVSIPAGSFIMGSPLSEKGRDSDETQATVAISMPFAAGKYEVTFAEWDACMAAGGCSGYRPADSGWGRGRQPVINVSWKDAMQYAQWLSQKTGKTYRLLSEAEWECASRAGAAATYSFGNEETQLGKYAWYNANSGKQAHPVGEKLPNAFGLHDVHGNVWEWVEDCYNGDCAYHVLRGGAWSYSPRLLRAAARGWSDSAERNYFIGFRLARTLP